MRSLSRIEFHTLFSIFDTQANDNFDWKQARALALPPDWLKDGCLHKILRAGWIYLYLF